MQTREMMKVISGIILVLSTAIMFSCGSGQQQKSYNIDNPNLRKVVVKEVVQTNSYTYLKMKEESSVYWCAITRDDGIETGNTYYFDNWMEMTNFKSKELDKTFDRIYFIQYISDEPFASAVKAPAQKKGSANVGNMEVEPIDTADGGINLAELFKNRQKYAGEVVEIRGVVVKYTSGVMKKNWVHIQDGSKHGGDYDLTITTNAVVENGDIATFKGKIVLDKDFGHGYYYAILMEDAELTKLEKDSVLQ
jgi:hypothetical protein